MCTSTGTDHPLSCYDVMYGILRLFTNASIIQIRSLSSFYGTSAIVPVELGILLHFKSTNVGPDLIPKVPIIVLHGCFITLKPWTKRLRPLIRNFFIATDLITTLATHLFLWMDLFVQTVSIQCRRCLCTVSTMSTGNNDVHLWRYRSILDVALACKSTG